MTLYHYTSLELLRQILNDKEIKLSPSNLLKPVNPKIINGELVDETDSYKPVVWLTSVSDFNKVVNTTGLEGSITDKTEAAIVIETNPIQAFYKWDTWALKNGIDTEWFKALKKTASGWNDFYITETPIKIDKRCNIIFRPDIYDKLQKGV